MRDKSIAAQVALQIKLGKSVDAIVEMFHVDSCLALCGISYPVTLLYLMRIE